MSWTVGSLTLNSRLILGTGKYPSFAVMQRCHQAAKVEMVTLAVRRFNLGASGEENILHWIEPGIKLLPNTAGCFSVAEAIRVAQLAREALETPWIKLEVIGDEHNLYPDNEATLEAAKVLIKDGFIVLPYVNADPILARKLGDAGCAAVMPLGSAIGSGQGVQNAHTLRLVRRAIDEFKIPMIVDAGIGTASDATIAMELGADAVLINTAVAESREPEQMAQAMHLAVAAGRISFKAGRMPIRETAQASSPMMDRIGAPSSDNKK